MILYIFLCFALFCLGLIFVCIAYYQMNREDVVIIDDIVDRERVERFLSLPEDSREMHDFMIKQEMIDYD